MYAVMTFHSTGAWDMSVCIIDRYAANSHIMSYGKNDSTPWMGIAIRQFQWNGTQVLTNPSATELAYNNGIALNQGSTWCIPMQVFAIG